MPQTKIYNVVAPDGQPMKIEGPENATDEEIIAQAQRLYQPKETTPTFSERLQQYGRTGLQGASDILAGIGSGAIRSTLPLSGLIYRGTAGRLGVPPGTTLEELGAEPQGALQKAGMFGEQAAEFAAPSGAIGKLGDIAHLRQAGRLAQLVNLGTRGALEGGSAAGVAALQGANPTVAGTIGAASPFAGALAGGAARGLYRSVLKPSTRLSPEAAAAVTETGLQERLPVSYGGQQKLSSIVEDLNRRVRGELDPNVMISPTSVAGRIGQVEPRFATQVNPESELAALEASKQEFLRQHQIPGRAAVPPQPTGILDQYGQPIMRPGQPAVPPQDIPIPAPRAQDLKSGTYARTYARKGEQGLTAAGTTGQTTLARGLKEELAAQFPQIVPDVSREARLLNLSEQMEPAINRLANREAVPFAAYFNPMALFERLPLKSQFAIALEAARRPTLGRLATGGASQFSK